MTREKFNKLCIPCKCPSVPLLGRISTLNNDMEKLKLHDIKKVLMYGGSDLLLSYIYFNTKISDKMLVLNDIDKYEEI